MELNNQKAQDIVDATDSLEAVGASRSMKNFLFFVILIGLLLLQMIFWLDRMGLVEKACAPCGGCQSSCPTQKPACPPSIEKQQDPAPVPAGPLPLAATVNVAEEVQKVTEEIQQSQPQAEKPVEAEILLEKETDHMPAEQVVAEVKAQDKEPFRFSCNFIMTVVVICNFAVISGTILYSLTLLMCLKISLAGRLGGMNHITKAFFISLFMMVIIFPWQQVLPGVLIGAVWLPSELFCGGWAKAQSSRPWEILFYARFCGLWFIAIWFLFWAQIRTGKWARATLRRLGVVR